MKTTRKIILMFFLMVVGVLSVYTLFSYSEDIIHYKNNFVRRFPHHVAEQQTIYDLKYNSYYFAGTEGDKVFLGNMTTPLRVTVLDTSLTSQEVYRIDIQEKKHPYRAPHVLIFKDRFFLYEGLVPSLSTGNTIDWKANQSLCGGPFFSLMQPMDSLNIAVRYFKPTTGENLLGSANLSHSSTNNKYETGLLQKQIDGVFDSDGTLCFDRSLNRLVYIYLYRNEYIVAKPDMSLDFRGHTIDTVSKAQIELVTDQKTGMRTFKKPPLIVNKTASVSNGLLFVNSTLPGQYESDELWKGGSIIDIYDLKERTYRSSFRIHDIKGEKVRSIHVNGNRLYALIGNHIVSYSLRHNLTAQNKIKK